MTIRRSYSHMRAVSARSWMCRLERGDRQDLLKLMDTGLVQILQAEVRASPGLVFVQRLAAGVKGPQTGDADRRGLERLANRTQQRLGHGCEPVHRAAAGPQEKHLNGGRDPAIMAKPLGDRGDVVGTQAERLLDVELRQPGGQGLGADEALGEGHGDTLRAVETANLPGSGAARIPTCPGATSGGDRPASGHRVNLRERYDYPYSRSAVNSSSDRYKAETPGRLKRPPLRAGHPRR